MLALVRLTNDDMLDPDAKLSVVAADPDFHWTSCPIGIDTQDDLSVRIYATCDPGHRQGGVVCHAVLLGVRDRVGPYKS